MLRLMMKEREQASGAWETLAKTDTTGLEMFDTMAWVERSVLLTPNFLVTSHAQAVLVDKVLPEDKLFYQQIAEHIDARLYLIWMNVGEFWCTSNGVESSSFQVDSSHVQFVKPHLPHLFSIPI